MSEKFSKKWFKANFYRYNSWLKGDIKKYCSQNFLEIDSFETSFRNHFDIIKPVHRRGVDAIREIKGEIINKLNMSQRLARDININDFDIIIDCFASLKKMGGLNNFSYQELAEMLYFLFDKYQQNTIFHKLQRKAPYDGVIQIVDKNWFDGLSPDLKENSFATKRKRDVITGF